MRFYILGFLGLMTLPVMAQLPESALDHLLQNPITVKRFENKKFGDRLFWEGGLGTRFQVRRSMSPRFNGYVSVGDWATPEHGWRVGFSLGRLNSSGTNMTVAGFSADYLLNFNAFCDNANYERRDRFEVFGVAGLDVLASNRNSDTEIGLGAHLGLRGQFSLTPFTYLYLEPQLGIARDNYIQSYSFHRYHFVGNVQAGLGYSLRRGGERYHDTFEKKDFLDNTFISIFGGPTAFLFDEAHSPRSSWGGRAGVGLGKVFNPYHAVRVSGHVGATKQGGSNSLSVTGVQADYLLNLHTLMGGYKAKRPFWINAVAGAGAYFSSGGNRRGVFGFGGGLQGNVRLNDRLALYVEPRIDAYGKRYAADLSSSSNFDVTGSVMAGITYYHHSGTDDGGAETHEFQLAPWQSHLFFDVSGGVTAIGRSVLLRDPSHYVKPAMSIGVGMWLSPSSGVRLRGDFGLVRPAGYGESLKYMGFAADYLWNITNTVKGYDPDHRRELVLGLGVTASRPGGHDGKYHFGVEGSLRRQWNLSKTFGIFVEPELKVYKEDYLPGSGSKLGVDVQAAMMAGLQFKMNAKDAATYSDAWDENGAAGYLSFAGGPAVQGIGRSNRIQTGLMGRVSYIQPLSPLNAWRYNLSLYGNRRGPSALYCQGTVGADFMTDFTARAYGYNPDRLFSLKGFAGAAVGMSYQNGDVEDFAADLEAGVQLSFRVSPTVNLYLEPQLGWSLNDAFNARIQRPRPAVLVGVDYMIKRREKVADDDQPYRKNFISGAAGVGLYSGTLSRNANWNKVAFASDVAYGRWMNRMHGFRVGAMFTRLHHADYDGYKLNSYHADYMVNLRRAITGTDGDRVRLTGFVGVNVATAYADGRDTRVAPGLQGSLQVGWAVAPACELFAEPSASMYANRLTGSSHPFEGEVRLMVGTKVLF